MAEIECNYSCVFHCVAAFKVLQRRMFVKGAWGLYVLRRLIRYPCINAVCMSPTPNRSSALLCFECDKYATE